MLPQWLDTPVPSHFRIAGEYLPSSRQDAVWKRFELPVANEAEAMSELDRLSTNSFYRNLSIEHTAQMTKDGTEGTHAAGTEAGRNRDLEICLTEISRLALTTLDKNRRAIPRQPVNAVTEHLHLVAAVSKIVWNEYPEETLIVGEYHISLMKVYARMSARIIELESLLAEAEKLIHDQETSICADCNQNLGLEKHSCPGKIPA